MIYVNGEPHERDGATPRAEWDDRRINEGERVEALSAMQGG